MKVRSAGFRLAVLSLFLASATVLPAPARAQDAEPVAAAAAVPESDLQSIGPVHRGQAAADVRKVLGRPAKKTRPELWGADGEWHSEWKYPARGVTVWMSAARKNGRPTVRGVEVAAPCDWRTTRGIGVGSTRADVEKAYPRDSWDPNVVDEDGIIVGSVFDGMGIRFADGKVVGISVGSFAE